MRDALAAHRSRGTVIPASAEPYPLKPVRVIVGLAPGGGADIMAREAAQRLTESLGRSFIVDNRPAAGGAIAGEVTARAAPDGYTLLLVSASTGVSAATHAGKLPYDAVRDFAPIILMATSPVVLVAHPGLPAKNGKELIALAKSRPGSSPSHRPAWAAAHISWASSSTWSPASPSCTFPTKAADRR